MTAANSQLIQTPHREAVRKAARAVGMLRMKHVYRADKARAIHLWNLMGQRVRRRANIEATKPLMIRGMHRWMAEKAMARIFEKSTFARRLQKDEQVKREVAEAMQDMRWRRRDKL